MLLSRQVSMKPRSTLLTLLATALLVATSVHMASASRQPVARAARVLRATDVAHLHYVSASGSLLYEVGGVGGTLPGGMHARVRVSSTFTGSFTIYAHGGSITGHGSARPHGSGIYESFAGTLVVSGGSGRFRRAHGRAGLYGTFNRRTYALVVQTTGTLYY